MKPIKTEFVDRSGKPIYVGDIVQYRLGTFGKTRSGPSLMRVIKTKKGIKLVDANQDTTDGQLLRKTYQEFLTIIDTSARKN